VNQRGSAATEVAILTPVLVLLLLLVVFGGRLGQADQDVSQATAEAARAVSLLRGGNYRAVALGTVRRNLAAAGLACRTLHVAVDAGGLRAGAMVTVTARCAVDLTGVAALGLPKQRVVTARASEVIDTYRGDG
jgi:Flp pilus assembly protein TadG